MNPLGSFLEKFKRNVGASTLEREVVAREISNAVGVVIEPRTIEIKRNQIFVNCHPAIKNEIFLQKENILNKLKSQGYIFIGLH